ncbi:hypothetical protein [Allokutzneria oryzae]|uniref:Subtilisin inhibitor domain-containing protein n=1 Tax=Allokutzneria oryzae TaxID=1378989 RepID=A0ABV6A166_9PSEU
MRTATRTSLLLGGVIAVAMLGLAPATGLAAAKSCHVFVSQKADVELFSAPDPYEKVDSEVLRSGSRTASDCVKTPGPEYAGCGKKGAEWIGLVNSRRFVKATCVVLVTNK